MIFSTALFDKWYFASRFANLSSAEVHNNLYEQLIEALNGKNVTQFFNVSFLKFLVF